MKGCSRGFFLLILGGLIFAGAGYALGWGDDLLPVARGWFSGETEAPGATPTPELAEATLDRFETFRAESEQDERLSLDGLALSSVVRYSLPGMLPEGVDEPTVSFRGDELLLSAKVAVASFPDIPALREVMGLLPDTVNIEMRGALRPYTPALALLQVESVEASRIPLPERMVPSILEALGRTDREGLPPDALVIPLPQGVAAAFVEDEQLVLVAEG